MKKLVINGKILSPKRLPEGTAILIERDRIRAIDQLGNFPQDIETLDAGGKWVTPGLIDIHVHGGAGSDTMDRGAKALKAMSHFFATTGVTSFLPTTGAATNEDITASIQGVDAFAHPADGARVLGIHLEGPYLGYEHKGAQPEQHLREAQPDEYQPWLESGVVKLFTVAPDVEGVLALIETGRELGVRFAVGHTSATYDQMMQAIDHGLTQATHTFNGMPQLHHREPGVIGAILTDERVYAQVIADGVHIHPAVIKLLFIAKGVRRTVLITDAIRAAGAEDGRHTLGDQVIYVEDGIARTKSGSLAGSTLTMDQALENACQFTGQSLEDILPSATSVPAESLGLDHQIGTLAPGYLADLVILDDDFRPHLTIIGGQVAYQK